MMLISRRQTVASIAVFALASALVSLSPAVAEDSASLKVGEFTFSAGEGWKAKSQPRAMSKGGMTYSPEGEGLEKVDADFYHFGAGQGGSVEANVQRWKGQFDTSGGAPVATDEKLTFGDRSATILFIKGTYLEGGPFQRKKTKRPDFALLGAILPSDAGAVFIKMVGPEKSVEAAREAFLALVKSAYTK